MLNKPMDIETKKKISVLAQKIFFEEINPNLYNPIFETKDKDCVITAIEKGLIHAVNQGRKW